MWKTEDWDFTRPRREDGWYPPFMDERHVEYIYRVMCLGVAENVLEIGCWNVTSTSAFVQALIDGYKFQLDLCDIEIRPALKAVVGKYSDHEKCIRLLETNSHDVISEKYDTILADGDHELEGCATELELLLLHNPKTIICHDTSVRVPWLRGSIHLTRCLKNCGRYTWFQDDKKRKGEWTERGLCILTRDPSVEAMLGIFRDEAALEMV